MRGRGSAVAGWTRTDLRRGEARRLSKRAAPCGDGSRCEGRPVRGEGGEGVDFASTTHVGDVY